MRGSRSGEEGRELALTGVGARDLASTCGAVKLEDADVVAYEPIWLDGAVVGFCTSGGYSHHAQKSIALGFVPVERVTDGLQVEIEILGQKHAARLITEPLFDADGARMRG